MVDFEDVRRIASRLPGAIETTDRFGFSVLNKGKLKGFAWVWGERVHPKKARVANPRVLVVSVPNLNAKEMFLSTDESKFFTEPHYNGFPAIFVRLDLVDCAELEDLLVEAWRCKGPKDAVQKFDLT